MKLPDHYDADVLLFFDGRPERLALYQALFEALDTAFPAARAKVQKSQISFYGQHLFAMASLPRRKRDLGILVSFGLGRRLDSLRVAAASEPYPGRWTHHAPLAGMEQLNRELLGWLQEAWDFSEAK